MARTKITSEIIQQVERMAQQGLTQEQCGIILGISLTTITHSRKLKDAHARGRAVAAEFVTARLWNKIREGDKASIFFWLKCQNPNHWRETQHLSISEQPIIPEIDLSVLDD